MSKYIDADVLLDNIGKVARELDTEGITDVDDMLDAMEESLRRCVYDMLAADVEPIVHGKWECADAPLNTSNRYCSECGYSEKIYAYNKDDFAYCRHCGARMDGGNE